MSGAIPFREIRAAALPHADELCRRWLPNGKRAGAWWQAQVPWREDRNPSLGVSLSTGRWCDFATGETGDLIDLWARIQHLPLTTAASDIAQIVGHPWRERGAA